MTENDQLRLILVVRIFQHVGFWSMGWLKVILELGQLFRHEKYVSYLHSNIDLSTNSYIGNKVCALEVGGGEIRDTGNVSPFIPVTRVLRPGRLSYLCVAVHGKSLISWRLKALNAEQIAFEESLARAAIRSQDIGLGPGFEPRFAVAVDSGTDAVDHPMHLERSFQVPDTQMDVSFVQEGG